MGKDKLTHLHKKMIEILRYDSKPHTGKDIASRLSFNGNSVAARNIADMKNEINKFAYENELEFLIGSGNEGYYYIDLSRLSNENKKQLLEEIENNIRTLRNRALNTLMSLKVYKKTKQKIETKDQIPIEIDENGQYSF